MDTITSCTRTTMYFKIYLMNGRELEHEIIELKRDSLSDFFRRSSAQLPRIGTQRGNGKVEVFRPFKRNTTVKAGFAHPDGIATGTRVLIYRPADGKPPEFI